MSMTSAEWVEELTRIDTAAEYFALTLTMTEDGKVRHSTQTQWVGEGSKRQWELRAPALVNPVAMRSAWRTVGQPSIVVNSPEALAIHFRIGGNAVVRADVFRQWLPDLLKPVECIPTRLGEGVIPMVAVPENSLRRAPTPKMRMDVIRRDGMRCRVCGRGTDDNVDIVLHVHHVRPHGEGGLTEPHNLLTLCHTCHTGLDPHFELRLLDKVPNGHAIPMEEVGLGQADYGAAVERYREHVRSIVDAGSGKQ